MNSTHEAWQGGEIHIKRAHTNPSVDPSSLIIIGNVFEERNFALKEYLEFYSFEEDKEGGPGVVLHVVVHTERQPVGQHFLHYRLSSSEH